MLSTGSSSDFYKASSPGDENGAGSPLPMVEGADSDDAVTLSLSETEKAAIDDIVLHAREEYTPEQYRRVLRKQDLLLLPLMWLCVSPPAATSCSPERYRRWMSELTHRFEWAVCYRSMVSGVHSSPRMLVLTLFNPPEGTQQADKTSVATQATFGLRDDLHMTGQQYPWLTTVFYLAYRAFLRRLRWNLCIQAESPPACLPAVVTEPFSNYLMQRFSINQTLGTMMILWGLVVGSIAASQNWATVMALRALQGALESSISPAFLIITASYWKTEEHSLRALIWGTSNSGMGIITALGMYGIAKRASEREGGIAPWRAISLCA